MFISNYFYELEQIYYYSMKTKNILCNRISRKSESSWSTCYYYSYLAKGKLEMECTLAIQSFLLLRNRQTDARILFHIQDFQESVSENKCCTNDVDGSYKLPTELSSFFVPITIENDGERKWISYSHWRGNRSLIAYFRHRPWPFIRRNQSFCIILFESPIILESDSIKTCR